MAIPTGLLFADPRVKPLSTTGAPQSGCYYCFFISGTSTLTNVYANATLATPLSQPAPGSVNPVAGTVAAGDGRFVPIYLDPKTLYRVQLYNAAGQLLEDTDPYVSPGVSFFYAGLDTGAANAYILTTNFGTTGYGDGMVVYWVPSHTNTGGSTVNLNGFGVVNITNPDGSALSSGQLVANQLTQMVYYSGGFQLLGLAAFTGVGVGTFGTEGTLASAATTDLGTVTTHVVNVTGVATINTFGVSAVLSAPIYVVRFTGACTLTYDPISMILPGAASISVVAGDAAIVKYLGGSNWQVLVYQTNPSTRGSFTATITGCTTSPTVNVLWVKVGPLVIMSLPGLTATSNSTACTLTGLPAALQPPLSGSAYDPAITLENNGVFEAGSIDIRNANGGSLILNRLGGAAFTAAGTKGILACTFMYAIA